MTSRRVSFEQLETLWEFLNSHRDIAMGYNKSLQAREFSRRLWTQVAEHLNSVTGGAIKDVKGWAAYWVDYKGKLKRKCAAVRAAHARTGGGLCEVTLTDIEKKYLVVLGEGFGSGLPGIQVDPFDTESTHASTSHGSQSILDPTLIDAYEPSVDVLASTEEPQPAEQPIEVPLLEANPPATPAAVRTRRQRRRVAPLSQESARISLVQSSRMRAEATQDMRQTLINIEGLLARIAGALERLENRIHATGMNTDEQ